MDPALEPLFGRAARGGVFLDFDGTLSEIAPTPEEARALPDVPEVLSALARRFRVVGVISGRRAAEVEERLGRVRGLRVFGLYGGEAAGSDGSDPGHPVDTILPRVRDAAGDVEGAIVEPKASNVAVHYRLAPDASAARAALLGALEPLAREAGMDVVEGKRVLELAPRGSAAKGALLAREAAGLEAVLYAGDDLADLDAFRAVDELAARGAVGIRVAVGSSETPAELTDAADVVVDGPSGLLELLRALVR